jgi:serine/threonine protein phosphatase PrpC
MLRFGGCSDRGRIRERNEDSFLFDEPLGLAIVADGMGGHRAGEVASQMAIELIYQKLQKCSPTERSAHTLREALTQASSQIYECGRKDVTKRDMGSTVVALWILESRAMVAHVGDSRAYLCRNGEVRPLTHDHTLVQELINAGRITPEEAETHRLRNVLSRAMGVADETEADLLEFEVESGDRIVLCSDGLYGYTTQDALYQLIQTPQDPTEKAGALIRLANECGGGDNITAVIVDISGLPKKKVEEYRDEPTLEMNSSAMNAVISAIDLAEAQLKTQEMPPVSEEKGDLKTHEELPVILAHEMATPTDPRFSLIVDEDNAHPQSEPKLSAPEKIIAETSPPTEAEKTQALEPVPALEGEETPSSNQLTERMEPISSSEEVKASSTEASNAENPAPTAEPSATEKTQPMTPITSEEPPPTDREK